MSCTHVLIFVFTTPPLFLYPSLTPPHPHKWSLFIPRLRGHSAPVSHNAVRGFRWAPPLGLGSYSTSIKKPRKWLKGLMIYVAEDFLVKMIMGLHEMRYSCEGFTGDER
nr:hypothetical protein Iba_chr11fCG10540 [Ipomoea batatas]GME01009.1 hypothetical protein Iba_scaffold56420CG0040 [Ipomoea batatas]